MAYTIDTSGNIKMYKGDYAEIPFTLKDAAGEPVDLTNSYIYLTAKSTVDEDAPIVIQSITTEHVNAELGESRIIITKAQSDVAALKYHAELRIDFDATPDPTQAKPNRFKKLFLIIDQGLT